MKIVCFGDLACPNQKNIDKLEKKLKNMNISNDYVILGNLEGLLVKDSDSLVNEYVNGLYNNVKVLKLFSKYKKCIFSIANNHVEDIPNNFEYTLKKLNDSQVIAVGASKERSKSIKPGEYYFNSNDKIAVFTHCWKVMTKITHKKKNGIYINDLEYKKFITAVSQYKKQNPNTIVIVYFHWNLDFEHIPFPQHMSIARKMIDSGVDLVLGSHSHLINGYEIYKNKCIAYGLGNFYIPSNYYYESSLVYPNDCDYSMVIIYDTITKKTDLFRVDCEGNMCNVNNIAISNFSDFDIKKYYSYFKKNRIKRKFVPILYDDEGIGSFIKEFLILIRIKIARLIKGWK